MASYRDSIPSVVVHHDPKTGAATGKRYELRMEIGKGGFGHVYKAKDIAAPGSPETAVKFLLQDLQHEEELVARFTKEARIGLRIRNAHVLTTLDYGKDQDGVPFMVMEYAEATLDKLIEERLETFMQKGVRRDLVTGKISVSLVPIPEICDLVMQICEGMQAVHDEKVIHRDLKPENIMLMVKEGGELTVKIADLGIARFTEKPADEKTLGATLTREGATIGSPWYFAPEQLVAMPRTVKIVGPDGEEALKTVGPDGEETTKPWGAGTWSDIYALGVIVYRLVTGQFPYEYGDGIEWNEFVGRVVNFEFTAPKLSAKVAPPVLERKEFRELEAYVADKLLAKRPWNRPASMREVQEWFAAFHERYVSRQAHADNRTVERELSVATDVEGEADMKKQTHVPRPAPSSSWATRFAAIIPIAALAALAVWAAKRDDGKATAGTSSVSAGPSAAPSPSSVPSAAAATVPAATATPSGSPAKRTPGKGPPAGSNDARDFAAAIASGDCGKKMSYSWLTLVSYPDFPEPHRVIGDCRRREGKVGDACASYAKFLAFEGVKLPADAAAFVEEKCPRSAK